MDKLEFLSDKYLMEMYESSKFFGCGIYVTYEKAQGFRHNLVHPCCWDFISFENIEYTDCMSKAEAKDYDWSVYNYTFDSNDISNGVYDRHPFENYTLKEILEVVGENGWNFEGM